MRKKIYISGPDGGDYRAARLLIDAGFIPVFRHVDPTKYAERFAAADALLRLPGDSLKTDIEVRKAKELGVPVFTSMLDLAGHFAVAGSVAA